MKKAVCWLLLFLLAFATPAQAVIFAQNCALEQSLSRQNQPSARNSDYGVTTQTSGDKNLYQPFLYTHSELDSETGFYHNKARHYAPKFGKFLARDPIASSNLYSYCGGDPINFSDRSGTLVGVDDAAEVAVAYEVYVGGQYLYAQIGSIFWTLSLIEHNNNPDPLGGIQLAQTVQVGAQLGAVKPGDFWNQKPFDYGNLGEKMLAAGIYSQANGFGNIGQECNGKWPGYDFLHDSGSAVQTKFSKSPTSGTFSGHANAMDKMSRITMEVAGMAVVGMNYHVFVPPGNVGAFDSVLQRIGGRYGMNVTVTEWP